MCVSFFCRLVDSKDKNWTFSWFQVRKEFWLLTTSIQRMKIDEKKKTTLRFSKKVENFDWKIVFYDWWRKLFRRVSVYENFEVFCILDATFQVWVINHQLRKKFFIFFRVSFFSLKIGRFILRQRLRRPSCVHSAFRKWIQQVWQRNVIFVFINLFHTTNSKSEFRIKPANVKCRVFIELFMQVFQKVEPIESCKRVTWLLPVVWGTLSHSICA